MYNIKSVTGDGFDKFTINPTSGEITVDSNTLNAEEALEYTLFVEALDTRTEIIRYGQFDKELGSISTLLKLTAVKLA